MGGLDASSLALSGAVAWCSKALLVAAQLVGIVYLLFFAVLLVSAWRIRSFSALRQTADYYRCLAYFMLLGGTLRECPYFRSHRHARVQLFSISLIFTLWDLPHYRNGTFQQDMVKNLRDVAIPGTGVPLSLVASSRAATLCFILLVNPLLALVSAMNRAREMRSFTTVSAAYCEQLLAPQEWFSFWRLNCRLATYHSAVQKMAHGPKAAADYDQEDKWVFLQRARAEGIPVTPWLNLSGIVVKHRNEEGGLGIACYSSATHGDGDWIVQQRLSNARCLRRLLPADAPLSTFRVVTASRLGLSHARASNADSDIRALSCVWRAGISGASTDHTSILFDVVDHDTGTFGRGTTNRHWYQRGLSKILTTPWLSKHNYTHHPDSGKPVTGHTIKEIRDVVNVAVLAHRKMCPEVPLVGWDVALTEEHGMVLLESNFSCNFFRGKLDKPAYFRFVEEYLLDLERLHGDAVGAARKRC